MEELLLALRSIVDPTFTYTFGNVWITIVLASFNLIVGIMLLMSLMSPKFRAWPNFHKIGIAFIVIGLIAKSGNQAKYILTGEFITEMQWPLQTLDNVGIWIIALTYVLNTLRNKTK